MLGEVTHLQAISDDLKALTSDPHKLPPASEQVRKNIKDEAVSNNELKLKQLTYMSLSQYISFWSCMTYFSVF